MKIYLTKSSGEGDTKLSAFDQAIFRAGIGNYNLLCLSSVIPPRSIIVKEKIDWTQKEFGQRLYVVMSSNRTDEVGKKVWAGIGWVQVEDGDGRGLFVEHQAESEEELIETIKSSLGSMVKYRPEKYTKPQWLTCGTVCKGKPVCAVVAAVYQSQSW